MCIGRPSPPPLPKPRPTAPRPEQTARRVVVGQQRTSSQKKGIGSTARRSRRLGTSSLRIPLLEQGQMGTGNLRY